MLPTLSPQEARKRIDAGAVLVDVRSRDEYVREHIPGARHHALADIEKATLGEIGAVVFHCRSGQRTTANSDRLAAVATGEAFLLQGGLDAWKKAGLPIVADKRQPLELMRQVQLAAGSLVLIGVGLGALVHPGFYALSGFVGAGLAFAGATGTCGMARLLSAAPWNNQSASVNTP